MEDKTFLDEKGLAEVAKLIKENYLGKDKLETLNELKKFVDSWHIVKVKEVYKKDLDEFHNKNPYKDYLASMNDPLTLIIWGKDIRDSYALKQLGLADTNIVGVTTQPYEQQGVSRRWSGQDMAQPILLINIAHYGVYASDRNLDPLITQHPTNLQIALGINDGSITWRWYNAKTMITTEWRSPVAHPIVFFRRQYDIDIKKLQDELAQVKDTLKKINKE